MGDTTLGLYGAKLAEEDPELYQSLQSRQARQQIANMLMQRGIQPRQGHMAGKFYVAPSWSQGLADMVQAGLGAWLTKHNIDESDLQAKAIQERKVRDRKEMEGDFGPVPAVPGKEAVEGVAPTVEGGNLDEVLGATPPLPAQEALPSVRPMGQDPRGLVAKALLSQRGVAPPAAPQPHPLTGIPQPAFGPQNPAPVPLPDIASEPAFNQMMQESPGFKVRNPDFTYEQALKSPHWYEPGGPVPTGPPPRPPQYQMPQVTNPGVDAQPAVPGAPGRERTPQEMQDAALKWMSQGDPAMRESAKFRYQEYTSARDKAADRALKQEELGLRHEEKKTLQDIQNTQFQMKYENDARMLDAKLREIENNRQDVRTSHADQVRLREEELQISRQRLMLDRDKLAREKMPTDAQGAANLYASRADIADQIIASLEGQYSPLAIDYKSRAGNVWIFGGALESGANALLSKESQRAEQAQRDFVNAVLRKESGAVISMDDFVNARKQYFPQSNDSKEVIEQKRQNRQTEIMGLRKMSGSWNPGERAVPPVKSPAQPTEPAIKEGATATNPETGERMIRKGGQWHPLP